MKRYVAFASTRMPRTPQVEEIEIGSDDGGDGRLHDPGILPEQSKRLKTARDTAAIRRRASSR